MNLIVYRNEEKELCGSFKIRFLIDALNKESLCKNT